MHEQCTVDYSARRSSTCRRICTAKPLRNSQDSSSWQPASGAGGDQGQPMTRICLYARTAAGTEDHLASQRESLRAFCDSQPGWQVVVHHADRAGGTTLERPGLQAMLDLARHGRIDVLLVYGIDRLSRNARQLSVITEKLDACNVILRSATEPLDTGSPAGRMMRQMLAAFSERAAAGTLTDCTPRSQGKGI